MRLAASFVWTNALAVRPGDQRSVFSVPPWWLCPGGGGGFSPRRHKRHRAPRVEPRAPAPPRGRSWAPTRQPKTHTISTEGSCRRLWSMVSWIGLFGSASRPSRSFRRTGLAPETGRSLNDSSGEPVLQSTLIGVACSLIVLAKGGSTPGADRPPASLASDPPWRRPGRHARSMVTSPGVRCAPAGRPGSGGWCPGPGSTGPRPARGSGTDARPRARRRDQPRRPPPR